MKKIHRKIKGFFKGKKDLAILFVVFCSIVVFQHFFVKNREFENKIFEGLNSRAQTELGEASSRVAPFIDAPRTYISFKYKPDTIKAIYLNIWAASSEARLKEAIEIARTTEINAFVIDVKDSSGFVFYDTDAAEIKKYNAQNPLILNIKEILEKLHKEKIYTIARIAVFQDPILARARNDLAIHKKSQKSSLWLDNLGLAWMDPSAREVWDYDIAIARDALSQGFDEVNFDYVRFPADGNLANMDFPFWDGKTEKHLILREFFKYLRENLKDATISADLFGLTTVNLDDMGMGQIIEDAFGYFDYICPMVYPSHYFLEIFGYSNPAQYPYEVIKNSLDSAVLRQIEFAKSNKKTAKLRPWLQDFNLLGVPYGKKEIRAEIQAVYDVMGRDFCGFMLWNPGSSYTRGALQPE